MTFEKLGSPLPSLFQKKYPYDSRSNPYKGKTQDDWLPFESDMERLERVASLSDDATGTLPERLIWYWLESRQYVFTTQYTVASAGARLDFLVLIGLAPGVAVRVQGNYFHTLEGREASDAIQKDLLIAKGYRVVDLWELDIYAQTLAGNLFNWCDEQLFIEA